MLEADTHPRSSHTPSENTPPLRPVIGIIYFTLTPSNSVPVLGSGELSIGIYIAEPHRRRGCGKEAVELALKHGFENLSAHRIQAFLMGDNVSMALGLFTHS